MLARRGGATEQSQSVWRRGKESVDVPGKSRIANTMPTYLSTPCWTCDGLCPCMLHALTDAVRRSCVIPARRCLALLKFAVEIDWACHWPGVLEDGDSAVSGGDKDSHLARHDYSQLRAAS